MTSLIKNNHFINFNFIALLFYRSYKMRASRVIVLSLKLRIFSFSRAAKEQKRKRERERAKEKKM